LRFVSTFLRHRMVIINRVIFIGHTQILLSKFNKLGRLSGMITLLGVRC
jgi:hypothetical protein